MSRQFLIRVLAGCLVAGATCPAAVLTLVPRGGPMIHANIRYLAAEQKLEVMVEPEVPQLTPLDVSNPADSFAALDPWFYWLDPSQQGMAFNRQYGLVLDKTNGDQPPPEMNIWVRCLTNSPGLELYYCFQTEPKQWDPIFGHAGSTNTFEWDLQMFHPAVAAPPSTNLHSALFEAFAVVAATGQPDPSIAAGQFVLRWTTAPSARPALVLSPDLALSWPVSATNYVLEVAAGLSASGWQTATNEPLSVNGSWVLPLSREEAGRFYRLRRTP